MSVDQGLGEQIQAPERQECELKLWVVEGVKEELLKLLPNDAGKTFRFCLEQDVKIKFSEPKVTLRFRVITDPAGNKRLLITTKYKPEKDQTQASKVIAQVEKEFMVGEDYDSAEYAYVCALLAQKFGLDVAVVESDENSLSGFLGRMKSKSAQEILDYCRNRARVWGMEGSNLDSQISLTEKVRGKHYIKLSELQSLQGLEFAEGEKIEICFDILPDGRQVIEISSDRVEPVEALVELLDPASELVFDKTYSEYFKDSEIQRTFIDACYGHPFDDEKRICVDSTSFTLKFEAEPTELLQAINSMTKSEFKRGMLL